uniref:Uncharacterized protein n=1 Tax=Rhizophora mucronata TaxID=61149 RepID=A0A2P2IJ75_RHIMU
MFANAKCRRRVKVEIFPIYNPNAHVRANRVLRFGLIILSKNVRIRANHVLIPGRVS